MLAIQRSGSDGRRLWPIAPCAERTVSRLLTTGFVERSTKDLGASHCFTPPWCAEQRAQVVQLEDASMVSTTFFFTKFHTLKKFWDSQNSKLNTQPQADGHRLTFNCVPAHSDSPILWKRKLTVELLLTELKGKQIASEAFAKAKWQNDDTK